MIDASQSHTSTVKQRHSLLQISEVGYTEYTQEEKCPIPKKGRHLQNIDDKVDTLIIVFAMMAKEMIWVRTQQGWLGPDRIDSVPCHHFLDIPSYQIDSLYVLLINSKVPAELQLVLRVINRSSVNKGARAGPGPIGF